MQAEESVAGIAEEGNVEMQSEPESNRREEESTQHQTAYPPSSTPSQGSTAMQQTSSGLHDRAPSPLQSGPTQRQASVHYTELDALASRINDERVSTGEAYDDILLLSEVLGPHQSGGASHKAREAELWDQIPVLPVEETRRRTDPKTGKTRIKLSCGGVSVNKCQVRVDFISHQALRWLMGQCQVCLAQFKAGDMGAIFPGCTHW